MKIEFYAQDSSAPAKVPPDQDDFNELEWPFDIIPRKGDRIELNGAEFEVKAVVWEPQANGVTVVVEV